MNRHDISIADGLSGLGAALAAMAEQGNSMVYDKTHMVLADGDYALACSEFIWRCCNNLL